MKTKIARQEVVIKESIGRKFAPLAIVLSCAILFGRFSVVAQAQDCTAFAQQIVNQFGRFGQGTMQVKLATNRSDGNFVGYGEMPNAIRKDLFPDPFVYNHGSSGLPPSLSGTLRQFYSDRRYDQSCNGNTCSYPFLPTSTDNVNFTIWLGSYPKFGTTPGLVTWGSNSMQGQCYSFNDNGNLDGVIDGFFQNSALVFSLFNLTHN